MTFTQAPCCLDRDRKLAPGNLGEAFAPSSLAFSNATSAK
jgi:hypothetical protein